jgi:membrane-associated phospholipid phosphatase
MAETTNPNDHGPKAAGRGMRALRLPFSSWDTAVAETRMLAARSSANFRATARIILHRKAQRPPFYPAIAWRLPLAFVLSLTLISVLMLDAPLASFRGLWSPAIVAAAEGMTDIGWSGWYIIPFVFVGVAVNLTDWSGKTGRRLLILYNWTCLALFVLISIGLSGLAMNIVKRAIGRARPRYFTDSGVLSFNPFSMDSYYASFPSGHAATVGAVAGVVVLFFPRTRYAVIPVAIWVASTRAIVGAHYPSDIVSGLAFGFGAAVLTAIVFARLGYIFRQRPSGLPEVKRTFRIFW